MKFTAIFEHRRTAQGVSVEIDTARYKAIAMPGTNAARRARVAACDALAVAQHMLGADRPGDLHLCNVKPL